ncbi:hypothetical protein TcCL_ESM12924, partial [Trypanosoma cruzi]
MPLLLFLLPTGRVYDGDATDAVGIVNACAGGDVRRRRRRRRKRGAAAHGARRHPPRVHPLSHGHDDTNHERMDVRGGLVLHRQHACPLLVAATDVNDNVVGARSVVRQTFQEKSHVAFGLGLYTHM